MWDITASHLAIYNPPVLTGFFDEFLVEIAPAFFNVTG